LTEIEAMLIKELYNYPVKSLAGNQLESVYVEKRGFSNDRRFMFIDENNRFITARSHHQLIQIKVRVKNKELVFNNSTNQDQLNQPILFSKEKINVSIWNSNSNCHLIENNMIDRWISDFCGKSLRLVYMADDDIRNVNSKYSNPDDIVSFADGYPILITNNKSLDNLNQKLEKPVKMNRFRPNLVVDGSLSWEEDHWKKIKIGKTILRIAKPCARCIVTTLDPETSEQGNEPLYTLSKFRKQNNKVLFGMNAIVEQGGTISVGDQIELLN
jgi:uncharacterized protein YcbX